MEIEFGAVARTLKGSLRTIDVEHAAHVGADTGKRVQLTLAAHEEPMDGSGRKRLYGIGWERTEGCDRDPPTMSADEGRGGPGNAGLYCSLEANSCHNARGETAHTREDSATARHLHLRREEA